MRRARTLLVVFLPLLNAACAGEPRIIEPRTPPPRQMPEVHLPPTAPAAGNGRVVFDTTDGPMRISMQSGPSFVPPGAGAPPSRSGELCLTPCAADLPFGKYRLFMWAEGGSQHGDTDDLVVGEGVTVYRRAPGKYTTPSIPERIPSAVLVVGGVVLLTLGVAIATASAAPNADGSSSSPVPGLLLGAAGIGLGIGGGVWAYEASRATRQRGATTTWTEPQP
jgi:hypothetical protein